MFCHTLSFEKLFVVHKCIIGRIEGMKKKRENFLDAGFKIFTFFKPKNDLFAFFWHFLKFFAREKSFRFVPPIFRWT